LSDRILRGFKFYAARTKLDHLDGGGGKMLKKVIVPTRVMVLKGEKLQGPSIP
jgi:hypothetical protein